MSSYSLEGWIYVLDVGIDSYEAKDTKTMSRLEEISMLLGEVKA